MMKLVQSLLALLLLACASGAYADCSVTSNGLSLSVVEKHPAGITPLTVFFDATGTTSTNPLGGAGTAFQDISHEWNFGDTDVSGTGKWLYGANANGNSKNRATGPIVAHTYVNTGNTDKTYTVQDWSTDGTAVATCTTTITVYALNGPHGFSAANTTCVFNSTQGSGCPAGAGTLQTSSLATATGSSVWASGKAVLLKCGDSFTGNSTSPALTTARFGAYGTCQNQSTGRPQITGGGEFFVHEPSTDVAVSDLDLETTGHTGGAAINSVNNYQAPTLQITFYNIKVNGYNESYYTGGCNQCAFTQVYQGGMGVNQGTFLNLAAAECGNASTAYDCGGAASTTFINCAQGNGSQFLTISYNAIMGSFFDGTGAPNNGNGIETVRIPGGNCNFIANTTFQNANNVGAVLKFQCNNTQNTQEQNIGNVCTYSVFEDNYFTGTSGGQLVEDAPQNSVTDERLQYHIWERNWFNGTKGSSGLSILIGARNVSFRNNIIDSTTNAAVMSVQACRRGVEWNFGGGPASDTTAPDGLEFYNNTSRGGGAISFVSNGPCSGGAANNSFVLNNFYSVSSSGTGNTVSNNSTAAPGYLNPSGSFSSPFDYSPTTNFTGASSSVPNFFDYCGYSWQGAQSMGAFSQACK